MNTSLVFQIAITVLSYGLLILFVMVDGLRHSLSLKSLLLTLPHLVASFALVRSILAAVRQHHAWRACWFLMGLLTFSALA